jgi:glycosyltransferase involved in cell wall biosynthesis
MPHVSVIVTVYNRTAFLRDALDSIMGQTYRDFEVIVVDDSGTALSKETVAAYRHFESIRYVANPVTTGVALSIVRAARAAHGELVAILNDDDVWEPTLLAELVQPLDLDNRLVATCCDHWLMDAGGVRHAESEAFSNAFSRSTLPGGIVANGVEFAVIARGMAVNLCTVFRKDAIDWSLVVPEVAGAYDYWISCLLAATRRPMFYVPKRLAHWRQHPAMETRRGAHDKSEQLVYIYSTARSQAWFPEFDRALTRELANALTAAAREKRSWGRTYEARGYFLSAFLLTWNIRTLANAIATFFPEAFRLRLRGAVAGRADH